MAKRDSFIASDEDEVHEEAVVSEEEYEEEAPVKKPKPAAKKGKGKAKQLSDEDEEEEEKRPTKKRKLEKKTEKKPKAKAKASKNSGDASSKMNEEGESYLDLGKKRRATVRSFKGTTFLDIREFYGADGEEKPGKKGISLSKEQWETLKQNFDTIDAMFSGAK